MTLARDLGIMQRQFRGLAGFDLPLRRTNAPGLCQERYDTLLTDLSDLLFRRPELGEALWKFALQWQERCPCETTKALAAYVAYCREDYARAVPFLLAALAANPQNLDNWIDLGFALAHAGDSLGRQIIFDHAVFIEAYVADPAPVCTLGRLRDIAERIRAEGRHYQEAWRWCVPEAVRRRNAGSRDAGGGSPERDVAKL